MNRFRSAAASKTSRSGLEPLKMLRLVPCHPAYSRAPVQRFNARMLRGIRTPGRIFTLCLRKRQKEGGHRSLNEHLTPARSSPLARWRARGG